MKEIVPNRILVVYLCCYFFDLRVFGRGNGIGNKHRVTYVIRISLVMFSELTLMKLYLEKHRSWNTWNRKTGEESKQSASKKKKKR